MISVDKFHGCFLGLVIGDALGAPHEGGLLEKQLWRFIGKTKTGKQRYTDDTQMSLDLAQSFLHHGDINQDHLARTFANSYTWSRGYGPSAARLLKGVQNGTSWHQLNRKKFKQGSMGNGAAMRAPIIALCHPYNDEKLQHYTRKSAEITHTHPLAIEGAYLIAITTCLALSDATNEDILNTITQCCQSEAYRTKIVQCKTSAQQPHQQLIEKQ